MAIRCSAICMGSLPFFYRDYIVKTGEKVRDYIIRSADTVKLPTEMT